MAPIQDLESRDLAWVSNFVMQQMVILMGPMLEQLQQTDSSVEYVQRQVQRISMDVTELRGGVDRTSKCLAVLRQGLGTQNEGRCILQRGLECNTRTMKRQDEQVESVRAALRSIEESYSTLNSDVRRASTRHEELLNAVNENKHVLITKFDALQAKVERISADAHFWKDDVLNSDARLEAVGWQRDLRELRGPAVRLVPKMDEKILRAPPSAQSMRASSDSWPPKKSFSTVEVSGSSGGSTPNNHASGSSFADAAISHSSSSQQPKRAGHVGGSSCRTQLIATNKSSQQDHISLGVSERKPSKSWNLEGSEQTVEQTSFVSAAADDAHETSRLPLLAARSSVARPAERAAGTEGHRLRFTATMASPPSRGSHQ